MPAQQNYLQYQNQVGGKQSNINSGAFFLAFCPHRFFAAAAVTRCRLKRADKLFSCAAVYQTAKKKQLARGHFSWQSPKWGENIQFKQLKSREKASAVATLPHWPSISRDRDALDSNSSGLGFVVALGLWVLRSSHTYIKYSIDFCLYPLLVNLFLDRMSH